MLVDLKILYTELKRSKSDLRLSLNVIIGKVYLLLSNSKNPQTLEMIAGWRDDFQYLYGDIVSQISSNSKIDYKEILERYDISHTHSSNSDDELQDQVLLLFYAIQTVYSILLKQIVASAFSDQLVLNRKVTSSVITDIQSDHNDHNDQNLSDDPFDALYVQDIILGNFVKKVGIQNYIYPDWFCWPIFELDNKSINHSHAKKRDIEFDQNIDFENIGFISIVSSIHSLLQKFKSDKTVEEYVAYNRADYLKNIYEALIPKELRHALGEFYTPDWLAEEITNTTMGYFNNAKIIDKEKGKGKNNNKDIKECETNNEYPRLIDPSCGSGTFVLKAIYKIIDKGVSLSTILNSVAGTDINPLAVLTSKTNYILAILDYLIGKKSNEPSLHGSNLLIKSSNLSDVYKGVYKNSKLNSSLNSIEIPIYNLDTIYSWYDKDLQNFKANYLDYSSSIDNLLNKDNSILKDGASNRNKDSSLSFNNSFNWYIRVQNEDFGKSFKLCQSPKEVVLRYVAFDKLRAMEQSLYDGVIGNPPWVNWEYLPAAYREKTKFLWKDYKLFNFSGLDLSFSKEDISVILTYVVLDKLLRHGGILSFVIRQGIFKSAQNGVGFRRFRIKDECDVKVLRADDFSNIKVFDNATVNTAIVYLQKGVSNTYPVPYYLWKKREKAELYAAIMLNQFDDSISSNISSNTCDNISESLNIYSSSIPTNDLLNGNSNVCIAQDSNDCIVPKRKSFSIKSNTSLDAIKENYKLEEYSAMPAVANDLTSIWLTIPLEDSSAIKNCLGTNNYRARTGVFTGGANAVYWLDVKSKHQNNTTCQMNAVNKSLENSKANQSSQSNHLVLIENKVERARRKTTSISMQIEPDYIFPMVRGANIKKWQVDYDTYILCPHDIESKMWPIKGSVLKEITPKTFEYLSNFKKELDERKGFAGWEKKIQKEEFHAILRVGEYTFSKYKVVWKYIATEFICAVIGETNDPYLGTKLMLPNEKVMYISTSTETEAYYLCGVLSSSIVAKCVKGFMNPTSISAHVLDKLNIPDYDPQNNTHIKIAEACKNGHILGDILRYSVIVDDLVADLLDKQK